MSHSVIDRICIVELEGPLVSKNIINFNTYLETELSNQSFDGMVFDLTNTDDADSTGIGFLVGWYIEMNESNKKFALVSPPEQLENMLNKTKLDTVLSIFATRKEFFNNN